MESFAERLKKAMNYRNKRITDIDQNCNVNKGLICKYLKGERVAKQKNIYLIADYLKINPLYLLGLDDNMIANDEDNYIQNKK